MLYTVDLLLLSNPLNFFSFPFHVAYLLISVQFVPFCIPARICWPMYSSPFAFTMDTFFLPLFHVPCQFTSHFSLLCYYLFHELFYVCFMIFTYRGDSFILFLRFTVKCLIIIFSGSVENFSGKCLY